MQEQVKIWNKDIECEKDHSKIEAIQLERLRYMLNKAYENVKFYRDRFDGLGIKPDQVKSLDDLKNLPFTTKDDLRDAYPFGGGLHCSTADVYREGTCEDYFPNRVKDPTLVRPEMWPED